MSMRRCLGALALMAMAWAPPAPVFAQDPPPAADTPAAKYKALEQEFQKAQRDFFEDYQKAKTNEERQKLVQEKMPKPEDFAARFLKLADEHPKDPAAVDALVWIATSARPGSSDGKMAADRLVKEHITSERLGPLCMRLMYISDGEATLRSILEKSPHRVVQGQALYALAQKLKDTNDEAKTKEAESLFERVQEHYADIQAGRGTLGETAKAELNEIRNLGVGKPAPEIDGEDIDGKPMKLSEYKGKVVVLDFWGHW